MLRAGAATVVLSSPAQRARVLVEPRRDALRRLVLGAVRDDGLHGEGAQRLVTLIVPWAEERRPEKGTTSGERPHCALMLMRPTIVDRTSTSGAARSADAVKIAACWPFHESLTAATTSDTSEKRATGTTGPNCSSRKMRIDGVTVEDGGREERPRELPAAGLAVGEGRAPREGVADDLLEVRRLVRPGRGVIVTPSSQGGRP